MGRQRGIGKAEVMQAARAMQKEAVAVRTELQQALMKKAQRLVMMLAVKPRRVMYIALCRCWYGIQLPPMNSKAFLWSMQKRPCSGYRGRCAIGFVQYFAGSCKMQRSHVMQSWQTCYSFTVGNYCCGFHQRAPKKNPATCRWRILLRVAWAAIALEKRRA